MKGLIGKASSRTSSDKSACLSLASHFSPITLVAAVLANPAHQPRFLPHPDAASDNQRNRDEAGEKGCWRDMSDWAVNKSDNWYAQHQVQGADQRSFMKGAHA